jgi:hypothetical protein
LTTCDAFSLTIGQICSGSGCDTGNGGVSGTGDSGGGGGGPNTLTPGANATLKVVFSPDELIVNAVKGDDNVRSIKITNNGAEAVSFYAEIFGLPFNNSLNPEKMTLNPGESKQVKVSFSNYELGLYTGKIVFKLNSGVVLKEIKVIVNVRTSNFLFDVRVGLPFGGGSILPGEKLIANVNLDKIGVANNITKVSVYYVVKTFTGETVYEKGEDVDVVKGTRYSKEIPIESLPLGDYVLGIEVVYPGAFAAASTQFSVVETKPFNKTILIVIALVVVAVALAWVARVRRKRIGFG